MQTKLILILVLIFCSCSTTSKRMKAQMIDVSEFGIVGDGATDYSKEIQQIFDEASINKETVYFPIGTYVVKKQKACGCGLSIPSNLRIIGEDSKKTIIRLDEGHRGFTKVFRIKNVKNISISNLSFDGNRENQLIQEEHQAGIAFSNADSVSIINCNFYNTGGDGIGVRGPKDPSENIVINNCSFRDNGRNGITLGSGFDQITIKNSYFDGTSIKASPIDSEPSSGSCNNVTIFNNAFVNENEEASKITLGGKPTVSNYRFEKNTLKNVGLHFVRSKNVVIKNNSFEYRDKSKPVFKIFRENNNILIDSNYVKTSSSILHAVKSKGEFLNLLNFTNNHVIFDDQLSKNPFVFKGSKNVNINYNEILFNIKPTVSFIHVESNGPMENIIVSKNTIENAKSLLSIKLSVSNEIDNINLKNNKLINVSDKEIEFIGNAKKELKGKIIAIK